MHSNIAEEHYTLLKAFVKNCGEGDFWQLLPGFWLAVAFILWYHCFGSIIML